MPELLETRCDLERVAFIFNPASGVEDGETRRAKLEELARSVGLACELAHTDAEKGARPLAEEAVAAGVERVIVSGGDGSVTEAAGALAGTDSALAVVPGGTGNLLAVNLGIPTDPAEAVRLAVAGEVRRLDVGRANGEAFLIMAGMGADARMIHDADRELKNRLGALAYFVAAWRNLGRPRVLYRVTLNGRTLRRRAQTVLVANMGRITGGVELVPGADPADGLLDVAIVRIRSFRDLVVLVFDALLGRRSTADLMEIHRARSVLIETETPQPVQLDGNEGGSTTRLEVRVEPGVLQLVAPAALPPPVTAAGITEAAIGRNWAPALTVLGAGAALTVLARRQRAQGRQPGVVTRYPWLSALLAGAAAVLLTRRPRRPAAPLSPAAEEGAELLAESDAEREPEGEEEHRTAA